MFTKYKPHQWTLAQKLLIILGVDAAKLIVHSKGKMPTHTKRGPGRKHSQGKGRAYY